MSDLHGIREPLFLRPTYAERVWGGNRLRALFGKALPPKLKGKIIGESWECSDRPDAQSVVAGGSFDGLELGRIREAHGEALLGAELFARKPPRFPLLVKFVDAAQDLSVQVHPDDDGARRLGIDDRGKSECWVIVHAEPGARIQRGLKSGVTRGDFERALRDGTVEDVLHYFPARVGDCVAVPPGMVHAIGGGVTLAEVQQNSDVTFRVFDYNRKGLDGKPRQLHVEQALACIAFDGPPKGFFEGDLGADTMAGRVENFDGHGFHVLLLKGRYFDLQKVVVLPDKTFNAKRRKGAPTVLVCLSGLGSLDGRPFAAGQTVLLPADLPSERAAVREETGSAPLVWIESAPTPDA